MPWLTIKEARRAVDDAVSVGTMYRLAHSGEVLGTQVLGKVLIDSDSLRRYLAAQTAKMIVPKSKSRRRCKT